MLSETSAEIARSLIQENLICQALILKSSREVPPASIGDELRELAEIYTANAEDLRRLLETHGKETEGRADEFPATGQDLLRTMVGAASRLKRHYAAGVTATRELSERLPRQFARTELAYAKLKNLTHQLVRIL